jgi:hypothetical protein
MYRCLCSTGHKMTERRWDYVETWCICELCITVGSILINTLRTRAGILILGTYRLQRRIIFPGMSASLRTRKICNRRPVLSICHSVFPVRFAWKLRLSCLALRVFPNSFERSWLFIKYDDLHLLARHVCRIETQDTLFSQLCSLRHL